MKRLTTFSGIVLLVLFALACLGAAMGSTDTEPYKIITGALLLLGLPGVILFRIGRRATRINK